VGEPAKKARVFGCGSEAVVDLGRERPHGYADSALRYRLSVRRSIC